MLSADLPRDCGDLAVADVSLTTSRDPNDSHGQPSGVPFLAQLSALSRSRAAWVGYWKPALFELGIRLKQSVEAGETTEADALAEYQQAVRLDSQGSVWGKPSKIGCLVWLDVRGEAGSRVLLTNQSKLRITGRIFASSNLEMGVSTYEAGAGFNDKFSCAITVQGLNRSPEGKFEWAVNVGELLSKSGRPATGSVVHDWWCVTESNTDKFEIIRIEILDR